MLVFVPDGAFRAPKEDSATEPWELSEGLDVEEDDMAAGCGVTIYSNDPSI